MTLAQGVEVVLNGTLVATTCWLAYSVTIAIRRLDRRLSVVELKTFWLRVHKGPGNQVRVEGQLDGLCLHVRKVEDRPYAS